MLNGLFLGIRDTIPLMQAYQIMSPIRLLKYVIVFPNSCTKLGPFSKGGPAPACTKRKRRDAKTAWTPSNRLANVATG
jgi:hypothetical protein